MNAEEAGGPGPRFIAMLGIWLTTAIFIYYATYPSVMLREADLWWHIKTGQVITSTWTFPHVDTFSYTYEGQPWIAKEWLSQVLFSVGYGALGWAGPLLLASASVALAGWLFYRHAASQLMPLYAGALTLFSVLMVQGTTVARPVVFIFPVAISWTITIFESARRGKAPALSTALILLLWVNLHGSFPLAFPIAGFAFLHFAQGTRLRDRMELVKWLVFIALCALTTLVNPYFIKPYMVASAMANGISAMAFTSEWFPLNARQDFVLEAGIMVLLFLAFLSRARLSVGQILFVLFTLHMMLSYVRFAFLFFLLAPVAILPEIASAQPQLSRPAWLNRPRDAFESFFGKNSNWLTPAAIIVGMVVVGLISRPNHVQPPETTAISGALRYIADNRDTDKQLQAHVFNEDFYGGPLILAGIKSYIDGRTDQLFAGDFLQRYVDSGNETGKPALEQILSDKSIGWTIFPRNDVRNPILATMPEWQKTYEDEVAIIYERKG